MYQPYPGGGKMPESAGSFAPRSVLTAVRVMYSGAAASLIGIAVDMTTKSAMRTQVIKLDPKLTPSQVSSAVNFQLAVLVVYGLVAAAVWLWMASACKSGKRWARMASTALFVVSTVSAAVNIFGGAIPGAGLSRDYSIVIWLIGLAAIAHLYQRQSSEYFRGVADH